MKYYIKSRKQFRYGINRNEIKAAPGIPTTDFIQDGYKIYRDLESAIDDKTLSGNAERDLVVQIHSFVHPIYGPMDNFELLKNLREFKVPIYRNNTGKHYPVLTEIEVEDDNVEIFEKCFKYKLYPENKNKSLVETLLNNTFNDIMYYFIGTINGDKLRGRNAYLFEDVHDNVCLTNINSNYLTYLDDDCYILSWHKYTINKYREELINKYGESYINKRLFKYRLVTRDEIKDLEIYKFLFKYGNSNTSMSYPSLLNLINHNGFELKYKYDINSAKDKKELINLNKAVFNTDFSKMISKRNISNKYKPVLFKKSIYFYTGKDLKKLTGNWWGGLNQVNDDKLKKYKKVISGSNINDIYL